MSCSSDSEQGEIPGLSDLMAAALKVVSAPDAFTQVEKPFQPPLLPNFSFNKRGSLVKTMSRKHSIFRQSSETSAAATLRQLSNANQESGRGAAALSHTASCKHSNSSQLSSAGVTAMQLQSRATVYPGSKALAPIPEDMSVAGSTPREQVQLITSFGVGC